MNKPIAAPPTSNAPQRRPRRWLRRIGISFVASAILFVVGSWWAAYKLTGPKNRTVNSPIDFPFPIETVQLTTADGVHLHGWFVPANSRDRAILLVHGYGGTRASMLPRAKCFRTRGYNVLACDARACGESSGTCITFGCRESDDLRAGLEFLRGRGCRRIACLGVSQGGATILMSAKDPARLADVRCVVCESVFDDLEHAVDRRFRRYLGIPAWPACCLLVPFAESRTGIAIGDVRPVDHIGKLPCPVLLICGDKDNRVYQEDTDRLFAAAIEPKELWIIPGAGHEDLFRYAGYESKVTGFLNQWMQ